MKSEIRQAEALRDAIASCPSHGANRHQVVPSKKDIDLGVETAT